ncbi:MAG TPA: DUF4132 domain-containing protein [Kofleriaceae bacterium]|nr:DUF4132 domain-containing protein [Kofleriaceae bacterium]
MAKTKQLSVKAKPKAKSKQPGKPAPRTAKAPKSMANPGWLDAGKGFELGIRDLALVARKDGKSVSVPKALKEGPLGERLVSAVDFLEDHARTCMHSVETWMLRSLPVPKAVISSVIPDDSWAAALKDLWLVAVAPDGSVDREVGGFFRGVDPEKGVGVVDRDGETTWLATDSVLIPHPILLDELDDLRQMAVEINAQQGTSQLFRETFARPTTPPEDPTAIDQFSGGEFSMLQQVTGLAKRLGYRVSGGAAVCRVLERGRFVEARYDLGEGDGMDETTTGELSWVDDKQHPIAVVDVPPVAFSEGMRMASQIYAKRKVEKEESND